MGILLRKLQRGCGQVGRLSGLSALSALRTCRLGHVCFGCECCLLLATAGACKVVRTCQGPRQLAGLRKVDRKGAIHKAAHFRKLFMVSRPCTAVTGIMKKAAMAQKAAHMARDRPVQRGDEAAQSRLNLCSTCMPCALTHPCNQKHACNVLCCPCMALASQVGAGPPTNPPTCALPHPEAQVGPQDLLGARRALAPPCAQVLAHQRAGSHHLWYGGEEGVREAAMRCHVGGVHVCRAHGTAVLDMAWHGMALPRKQSATQKQPGIKVHCDAHRVATPCRGMPCRWVTSHVSHVSPCLALAVRDSSWQKNSVHRPPPLPPAPPGWCGCGRWQRRQGRHGLAPEPPPGPP